ncbi:MAG: YdcF family protein [bacterium]
MFLKKLISSLFLSPLVLIIFLLPVFFTNELKKNKKLKIYLLIFFIFIYFFSIDFGKNLIFYFLEKDYINYNLKEYITNILKKDQKIDLIVILTAGGDYRYQLSEDSYDRLMLSYIVYKNFNCDIFISGGTLVDNVSFKIPVSKVIYFYLTNLGVNKEKIFLDEQALDTFQNIKNLKIFLTNKKYKNILIITSAFHILRTKLLIDHIFKEDDRLKINFVFQGCSLKYSKFYDKYSFIPSFYNLYLSFVGIKEYFGIAYYYLYFSKFFIRK